MAIVTKAPQGTPWGQVLDPIFQILQGKVQQHQQQQQQIQQSKVLNQIVQESLQQNPNDPMAFIRGLMQAQAQGVSSQMIEPHLKNAPKLIEQSRKAKEYETTQDLLKNFRNRNQQPVTTQPNPSQLQKAGDISQDEGLTPEMPKTSERNQSQIPDQTPAKRTAQSPKYASEGINPALYAKNPSAIFNDVLKAAETGYTLHKDYMTDVNKISAGQKEIQRALKEALKGVRSGKVSGFGASIRDRISKVIPSIQGKDELAFLNSMKHAALQEFASTPGFRAQSEFQTLLNIFPNIGRDKEAQEYVLESYLEASHLKEKEAQIIHDIINESDIGEVPTNLRTLVDERMQPEWDKAYEKLSKNIPELTVHESNVNPDQETVLFDENNDPWAVPNEEVEEYITKRKFRRSNAKEKKAR